MTNFVRQARVCLLVAAIAVVLFLFEIASFVSTGRAHKSILLPNSLERAHVLVTGAAGFIGHHFMLRLKKERISAIGIDHFGGSADKLKRYRAKLSGEVLEVDVCDVESMKSVLNDHHITHVVNFAAQAGVTQSVQDPLPFVHDNIKCFVTLLELLKTTAIPLVYASSSSVYGLNEEMPFSESHPTVNVTSVYAATKVEDELLARTYWNMYRQKSIGLRFFTVYGPLGRPDMAYFSFANDILENRTIQVRNYGNQIRDFTYVDDIVDGVFRTLRIIDSQQTPLVLNLGKGEPHTVMELISNLEKSLGRKAQTKFVGQSTGDVPQTFADISLARKVTGYRPVVSFADGIDRFAKWYLQYIHAADIPTGTDTHAGGKHTTPQALATPTPANNNDNHHHHHQQQQEEEKQGCLMPRDVYVVGVAEAVKSQYREMCATLGTTCHFVTEARSVQENARTLSNELRVERQDVERVIKHLEVWRRVSDFGQSESEEWVVVLEPNAVFNPFVHNYYHAAIRDGVKEFFCQKATSQGLVYLGRCPSENASDVCSEVVPLAGFGGALSCARCPNTLCSYAYAVKRSVASDLYLNLYFKRWNVCAKHKCSVDWALRWYSQNVLKQEAPLVLHSETQYKEFDGLFVYREISPELEPETRALVDTRKGRLKMAVIANEFFAPEHGRMGGFGFAASRLAYLFGEQPWLGVDVVFLSGEHRGNRTLRAHGVDLLQFPQNNNKGDIEHYKAKIAALQIGLVLLIDCRTQYSRVLSFIDPKVPVLVWVRDPKESHDHKRINAVRVPGTTTPPKYQAPAVTGLDLVLQARPAGSVALAPVSPYLAQKIPDAYPEYAKALAENKFQKPKIYPLLPNLMDIGLPGSHTLDGKAALPTVAFLARLDPIKRPWLYVELARQLPNVTFLMAGTAYTPNKLGFSLDDLPPNVKHIKFASGTTKYDLLRKAWLVISTSAHEGLALNFLEAFWFSTPVVATTDPEGVISKFGAVVRNEDGDPTGMHLIPALVNAIDALLRDTTRRRELGKAAWKWVRETHTSHRFLAEFRPILHAFGIPVIEPPPPATAAAAAAVVAPPPPAVRQVLEPDLTVVVLCYFESRFKNLQQLTAIISKSRVVRRVVVICNNATSCPTFDGKVDVIKATVNSLNNRWDQELLNLQTSHALILDDDSRADEGLLSAIERSYQLAVRFPTRLVAPGGSESPCRQFANYSVTPCGSAEFLIPPFVVPKLYFQPYKEFSSHVVGNFSFCDDMAMFLIATAKEPAILLQPSQIGKNFSLSKTGLRSLPGSWRDECGKYFLGLLGPRGPVPRQVVQMINLDLPESF